MITIKEELIASTKLRRAIRLGGHEAVTLWLMLKAYAAAHPTDGFIPRDTVDEEAERLGIRRAEKALSALLECGELRPDGTRGPGLIESHEYGCLLHDYLDHALSGDELVERQMKDRERKQLQRDRARLRTVLMTAGVSSAEADRRVRDLTREQVTDALTMSQDTSRDTGCDSHTDKARDNHRDESWDVSHAQAPASADTHTDARAFPSPTQPSPSTEDGQRPGDVPCPTDLDLSTDERKSLSLGTGMCVEFFERAIPQLRARFMTDTPRSLAKWKRSLHTALTSSWNDRTRRDELLGIAKPHPPRTPPRGRPPVQPSHGVDPFALVEQETKSA